MNKRYIGLLASSHFIVDVFQGALPAMLPFLISNRNLSYAAAATLVFAANISSSVIQPLFGFYADKISIPWLMPLGVLLAGVGVSLVGVLPSYPLILIAAAIGGIGNAAFHPEGTRIVNSLSGEKKGAGVSTFAAGGNLGFAVGPILTTSVILLLGLKGALILTLPAIAIAFILFVKKSELYKYENIKTNKTSDSSNTVKDEWSAFIRLGAAMSCRSVIFFGLNTFLPLYWINVFGQSKTAGSAALTILIVTGATSTFFAGRLADKFGYKKIIVIGYAALIPFLFIFVNIPNVKLATLMLIPLAIALYAPYSPMVVYGQKYLPNHVGLASGVTLGLAISIGGIFAPMLGWISDNYGIHSAISSLAIVPVIATIISISLPIPQVDIQTKKETKKVNIDLTD